MAFSIRDLKRRMKSVKNTGQITRAMEAVSATKMRKAQMVALAARPYALQALEMLKRLSGKVVHPHWILERREPLNKIALLLFTSDKGLCGVLNSNIIRVFEKFVRQNPQWFQGGNCGIIAVGKFGSNYAKRRGYNVIADFEDMGDIAGIAESAEIAGMVLDIFKKKSSDGIFSIHTNFVSTLKQEAILQHILPLTMRDLEEFAEAEPSHGKKSSKTEGLHSFNYEYRLEPSPGEILETLLPKLLEVRMYHILLEANASEHSARMLAMKNASDNAKELLHELQLSYNKARQAGITREIAEITGGAAALEA